METELVNTVEGRSKDLSSKDEMIFNIVAGIPGISLSFYERELKKPSIEYKKGRIYGRNKINLYYYTCSCKHYRELARIYKCGSFNRLCKHLLINILSDQQMELDTLTRLMLEARFWSGLEKIYKIDYDALPRYLSIHEGELSLFLLDEHEEWIWYHYNTSHNYRENYNVPHDEVGREILINLKQKRKSY